MNETDTWNTTDTTDGGGGVGALGGGVGALEAPQDRHGQEHRTGTSRAEQTDKGGHGGAGRPKKSSLNIIIWVYILVCVFLFLPRVCTVTITVYSSKFSKLLIISQQIIKMYFFPNILAYFQLCYNYCSFIQSTTVIAVRAFSHDRTMLKNIPITHFFYLVITIGYHIRTNFCEHLQYANMEQVRLEDLLWIKEVDVDPAKQVGMGLDKEVLIRGT